MAHYVVTWAIDIEADSAQQAAEAALVIQRDATSAAVCFDVVLFDEQGMTDAVEFIDLV